MPTSDCKHLNCEAPLYPMEEQNFHHIWFRNEGICRRRDFQSLSWIKKQKLMAKKNTSSEGFFTVEMLNVIQRVNKGIVGVAPGIPLEQRADLKWIDHYRGKAWHPQNNSASPSTKTKIPLRKGHTAPKGIRTSTHAR